MWRGRGERTGREGSCACEGRRAGEDEDVSVWRWKKRAHDQSGRKEGRKEGTHLDLGAQLPHLLQADFGPPSSFDLLFHTIKPESVLRGLSLSADDERARFHRACGRETLEVVLAESDGEGRVGGEDEGDISFSPAGGSAARVSW